MAQKSEYLKKRLPDILLESLFIVLALLGALAIDEWRETRKKKDQAQSARKAIEDEIIENLDQIESKLTMHKRLLDDLKEKLAAHKKNPDAPANFDFNFPMALISSAAWDSAKMTQAIQLLPLEDVSLLSKIYQFQDVYSKNQDKIIEKVMTIGELKDEEFPLFARAFYHRLEILIAINGDLQTAYRKSLGREEPVETP